MNSGKTDDKHLEINGFSDFSEEGLKEKDLLLYDGDCGFCLYCAKRWAIWTQNKIPYIPSQKARHHFKQVPDEVFERSVVFINKEGEWWEGAAALDASFKHTQTGKLFSKAYGFPPTKALLEGGYRFLANNRKWASKITPFLIKKTKPKATFTRGIRLFMAGLGLSFFFAFLSFALEAEMLIGPRGILPLDHFMERLSRNSGHGHFQPGFATFWAHLDRWPSLTWLSSSVPFLYGLCGAGMLGAVLLAMGLAPGLLAFILWFVYLSITIAGQRFYYFQWDNLILEVGLLSACLLPYLKLKPSNAHLSRIPKVFWGFLLFKIVLSSAMAKWNSGDVSWYNLTALTYHYETQPLPTPLAFIFHQAPVAFHKMSCFLTFVIQMGAPFLLFGPRRIRHLGALSILFHQILIALTGNYNFFNLLTISLCFTQLDDTFLNWIFRRPVLSSPQNIPRTSLRFIGLLIATLITLLSFGRMCQVVLPKHAPKSLVKWANDYRSYRSINTYGLFARMTKTRPEITIQGSDDGDTWKDYVFHHKPGPVDRLPSIIAPLQPRVDWQMWFAALGSHKRNPWLTKMMRRIFENEQAVLDVFAHNPFPQQPPQYLRAIIQNYSFSTLSQFKGDGSVWQKETPRLYHPVMENKVSRR